MAPTINLNSVILTEDEMPVDTPHRNAYSNATLNDILSAVEIWHDEFSKAVLCPDEYPKEHEHLLGSCELLSELLAPHEAATTIIDHVLPVYVDST